MLPSVKPDNSGKYCDFVWLYGDAYGPFDPTCCADSKVILTYNDYEDYRCISHAAYDLLEALCQQLGIQRTSMPREAFKQLYAFFETYLATKFSTQTIQETRVS